MTPLQIKILEIYKEFKRICDNHDLRYFATGGSAIGAVRHKGFVPWDDDLDIDMPAEDYLRFIDIAKHELPRSFQIFNGLEREADYVFCKLHNVDTMLTTSILINLPESYTGVFIDIFPMSGMSNDSAKLQKFEKSQVTAIEKLFTKKMLTDGEYKKMFRVKPPTTELLVSEYMKTLTQYSFDDSEYVRRAGSTMVEQSRFRREWYDNFIEVPFEDTTIRLPAGYDKILRKRFGNYNKLPPLVDRVAVHEEGGVVDIYHGLKDYQNAITGKIDSVDFGKKFINDLADLANYEMMRYVRVLRDRDGLRGEVAQLKGQSGWLSEQNDILHREIRELEERNKGLTHELTQLNGIKTSGRLFAGNIKRRLKTVMEGR